MSDSAKTNQGTRFDSVPYFNEIRDNGRVVVLRRDRERVALAENYVPDAATVYDCTTLYVYRQINGTLDTSDLSREIAHKFHGAENRVIIIRKRTFFLDFVCEVAMDPFQRRRFADNRDYLYWGMESTTIERAIQKFHGGRPRNMRYLNGLSHDLLNAAL